MLCVRLLVMGVKMVTSRADGKNCIQESLKTIKKQFVTAEKWLTTADKSFLDISSITGLNPYNLTHFQPNLLKTIC